MYASSPYAIGYRINGQEAKVAGTNDGAITMQGSPVVQNRIHESTMADLNGDGFDDLVYTSYDTIAAYDLKNNRYIWQKSGLYGLDTPQRHSVWLAFHRGPIIADVDGDAIQEILAFGMDFDDNANVRKTGHQSSTLFRIKGSDGGIVNREFGFKSYAPAVAVGDFMTGNNAMEILVAALAPTDSGATPRDDGRWCLYMLDKNLTLLDSVYLCNVAGAKNDTSVDSSLGMMVNTAISVGNLSNTSGRLEVVFGIGKTNKSAGSVNDTLCVYQINTATGKFVNGARRAFYPVPFKKPAFWGASPALGDLNNDGKQEIAFATEDELYLLRMASDTNGRLVPVTPLCDSAPSLHFGITPDNRLYDDIPTPQPLIADVDGDLKYEVIVNHLGDGNIWAFNVDSGMPVCKGFPLKTKGRISQPCLITDLDNDGIMDLVATDDAGYMNAFALGRGTAYEQPWPCKYGNAWKTGYNGYKPLGNAGHVFEQWDQAQRGNPYKWLETGANNTLIASSGTFTRTVGTVVATTGGDRNYHLTGPGLDKMNNYTVRGSFKCDNNTDEMGINFYSTWPYQAKKYTIMRKSGGNVALYYYPDSVDANKVLMQEVVNVVGGSGWYNYEIIVVGSSSRVTINAKFWLMTDTKPVPFDIDTSVTANIITKGTVGVVSKGGSGQKKWGPITVVANTGEPPAYMAQEDFASDTIVDVKPYVPLNWHPDNPVAYFGTGADSSGFVFDKNNNTHDLVYRHKPGMDSVSVCRLIPATNLDFRDYEFRGTISKLAGTAYDSIGLGAIVYMVDKDNYYVLKIDGFNQSGTGNNKFKLVRHYSTNNGTADSILTTLTYLSFSGDTDAVNIGIQVSTNDLATGGTTVPGGMIVLKAKVWAVGTTEPEWGIITGKQDKSVNRKRSGYPGIIVNLPQSSTAISASFKITFSSLIVQKIRQ